MPRSCSQPHVGVAAQEPAQLADDRPDVQLLGGQQREPGTEIDPQLVAEDAAGAGAGAVGLGHALVEHPLQQIEVGPHVRDASTATPPGSPPRHARHDAATGTSSGARSLAAHVVDHDGAPLGGTRLARSRGSGVEVDDDAVAGRVRLAGEHVAAGDLVGLERVGCGPSRRCPPPASPGRYRTRRRGTRTARRSGRRAPPPAPARRPSGSRTVERRPSSSSGHLGAADPASAVVSGGGAVGPARTEAAGGRRGTARCARPRRSTPRASRVSRSSTTMACGPHRNHSSTSSGGTSVSSSRSSRGPSSRPDSSSTRPGLAGEQVQQLEPIGVAVLEVLELLGEHHAAAGAVDVQQGDPGLRLLLQHGRHDRQHRRDPAPRGDARVRARFGRRARRPPVAARTGPPG